MKKKLLKKPLCASLKLLLALNVFLQPILTPHAQSQSHSGVKHQFLSSSPKTAQANVALVKLGVPASDSDRVQSPITPADIRSAVRLEMARDYAYMALFYTSFALCLSMYLKVDNFAPETFRHFYENSPLAGFLLAMFILIVAYNFIVQNFITNHPHYSRHERVRQIAQLTLYMVLSAWVGQTVAWQFGVTESPLYLLSHLLGVVVGGAIFRFFHYGNNEAAARGLPLVPLAGTPIHNPKEIEVLIKKLNAKAESDRHDQRGYFHFSLGLDEKHDTDPLAISIMITDSNGIKYDNQNQPQQFSISNIINIQYLHAKGEHPYPFVYINTQEGAYVLFRDGNFFSVWDHKDAERAFDALNRQLEKQPNVRFSRNGPTQIGYYRNERSPVVPSPTSYLGLEKLTGQDSSGTYTFILSETREERGINFGITSERNLAWLEIPNSNYRVETSLPTVFLNMTETNQSQVLNAIQSKKRELGYLPDLFFRGFLVEGDQRVFVFFKSDSDFGVYFLKNDFTWEITDWTISDSTRSDTTISFRLDGVQYALRWDYLRERASLKSNGRVTPIQLIPTSGGGIHSNYTFMLPFLLWSVLNQSTDFYLYFSLIVFAFLRNIDSPRQSSQGEFPFDNRNEHFACA